MNRITRLACVPAACLLIQAGPISAQQSLHQIETARAVRDTQSTDAALHRITGVVKDPTGAVVAGARVEITDDLSGFRANAITDESGRWALNGVAAGRYELTAIAPGFATEVVAIGVVSSGDNIAVDITLHVAPTRSSVEVKAALPGSASATLVEPGLTSHADTANTAELVARTPGVSVRENGALGSIPLLHGLGDERTRIVVDGMIVSSACPNHMNPPSSYMAPSHAARITVMPGITPVSMGGDSLGGTIAIESTEPTFAAADEGVRATVNSSGFYRSNGENYGGSFTEWIAGRHLGLGYSGYWATNDDYADGGGHKVTSTYAQSTDHSVIVAARGANSLISIRAGLHHVPYEGFPSAQMDKVRDYAESLNLHYRRSLEHGVIESHVYWQGAWHSMNIGKDKSTYPMPMWMPMNTHGKDFGYGWKLDLSIAARHNLTAGNELHRFVLDDRWPAVPGTAPGMGPDTFLSINEGHRTRWGWFAELTSQWNSRWTTLLGLRSDTVWMNTGDVHGYSMMYAADANAFNAARRDRRDDDLDATAWTRYEPNGFSSFELGYARKTRAPNLYERYAWSTSKMVSGMIGWFADGNYYVGNLALRPEIAHSVGGTASWHDRSRTDWEARVTPFVTSIHGFIDVDTLKTFKYSMTTLAQLRFANHDARIAGVDLSGSKTLWQNDRLGLSRLNAVMGWLHGERLDTSTGLYQMMPLHVRLAFDEQKSGFSGGFGVDAADRKSHIDPSRYEQRTPGYALFDVHAGYQRGHFRLSCGSDNLLNRNYELPLGGVNFDDFMARMRMTQLKPLTGRGRSVFIGLSAQF